MAQSHAKRSGFKIRELPPKIDTYIPESKFFTRLQAFERKLDTTMMRKRLEVQEAFNKPSHRKRTLRIFVSNLAANQPSSSEEDNSAAQTDASQMNTEAKQGDTNKSADSVEVKDDEIPSWTLRIEGRLIDPPGTTWKNRPAPRKFTEFIQSLIVELDRDPNQYKDNTVSWNRSLATEDMDGFEIKRMGDQNVKARILIQPCTPTDKYELTSPALCDLLDIRGAVTRAEVIRGLWQYIKLNDLQDPNDSELVKCDQPLQDIFASPTISFARIPELLRQFYAPPKPILIEYTIRVDDGPVHRAKYAFDIQVEVEEPYRHKLGPLPSLQQQQREIAQLDEQISHLLQQIYNSRAKRDFLRRFSEDPAGTINQWVDSQARDLETILGNRRDGFEAAAGALTTGLSNAASRSQIYSEPWVEEALYHYLYTKSQERLHRMAS